MSSCALSSTSARLADGSQRRWAGLIVTALLLALYWVLRLPNLRAMPVFCDEAIYLRWAQLVRVDPAHNLWVSMRDAKLPLHYWLMAVFFPIHSDPVMAGRLVSVAIGALGIPPLLALCRELCDVLPATSERHRRLLGPLVAFFYIACPYFAFYQRMALAEPLLLTESIVLAWLSLRLARKITAGASRRDLFGHAIALGGAWALTLLTKQNFSYLLWCLPVLAMAAHLQRDAWRAQLRRFIPLALLSTTIGLVFFVPALFTDSTLSLHDRLVYKNYFYQSNIPSRWTILRNNLQSLLVPTAQGRLQAWPGSADAPLETGILYAYLTPPIYLLAIGTLLALARQGKDAGRVLLFCGVWLAALTAPTVIVSAVFNSRYNVLCAVPLILLAGWGLASLVARATRRNLALAGALLAAALAWPLVTTSVQARDWRAPTLTLLDRQEYFSKTSAGGAAEQAVDWLRGEMRRGPITVVTRISLSVQNDFAWLVLRDTPGVRLLASNGEPPLKSAAPPMYPVCTEPWAYGHDVQVPLRRGQRVLMMTEISREMYSTKTLLSPGLRAIAPDARIVRTFMNPPATGKLPCVYGIAIVEFTL